MSSQVREMLQTAGRLIKIFSKMAMDEGDAAVYNDLAQGSCATTAVSNNCHGIPKGIIKEAYLYQEA